MYCSAHLSLESILSRLLLLVRGLCSGSVALAPAQPNITSLTVQATSTHRQSDEHPLQQQSAPASVGDTIPAAQCDSNIQWAVSYRSKRDLCATASSAVRNLYLGLAPRLRTPTSVPLMVSQLPAMRALRSPAQDKRLLPCRFKAYQLTPVSAALCLAWAQVTLQGCPHRRNMLRLEVHLAAGNARCT